jgi:hypothetical protein
MVRLPHVSLQPGLAIFNAVLLLMDAKSRVVAATISHGNTRAISVYFCVCLFVLQYDAGPLWGRTKLICAYIMVSISFLLFFLIGWDRVAPIRAETRSEEVV